MLVLISLPSSSDSFPPPGAHSPLARTPSAPAAPRRARLSPPHAHSPPRPMHELFKPNDLHWADIATNTGMYRHQTESWVHPYICVFRNYIWNLRALWWKKTLWRTSTACEIIQRCVWTSQALLGPRGNCDLGTLMLLLLAVVVVAAAAGWLYHCLKPKDVELCFAMSAHQIIRHRMLDIYPIFVELIHPNLILTCVLCRGYWTARLPKIRDCPGPQNRQGANKWINIEGQRPFRVSFLNT